MGITHHQQLDVSGTAQFSGNVVATASGKYVYAAGVQNPGGAVTLGTTTLSGKVTLGGTLYASGSSFVGSRNIATAGSSTVALTGLASTSRVIVSARTTSKTAAPSVMTLTTNSMKLGLFTGTPTAATGTVYYQVWLA